MCLELVYLIVHKCLKKAAVVEIYNCRFSYFKTIYFAVLTS